MTAEIISYSAFYDSLIGKRPERFPTHIPENRSNSTAQKKEKGQRFRCPFPSIAVF